MRQARGVGSLGEKGGVNKIIRQGFRVRVTFAQRPQVCEEQDTQLSGEGVIPGHGRARVKSTRQAYSCNPEGGWRSERWGQERRSCRATKDVGRTLASLLEEDGKASEWE